MSGFLQKFLVFVVISTYSYSQCTGSLGDPVVKIDFGNGAANPGPAQPGGTTNYTFTSANCPPDGSYTIRNATSGCFSSWHTLTQDHTSGDANGYFMIVNAANTAGEFYKKTIGGLCPGTGYEFSAYVINLLRSTACTSNANRFPKLTFRIETPSGTVLSTFNTAAIPTIAGTAVVTPAQWSRQALFFTSTSSSVVLKIINNAPGGCGNDLALDDIEFRPCGPTLSIAGGPTTICEGSSVALTSSISGGYSNAVYQWQESTNNVSFSNIAGGTNSTLSYSPTTGTKYYRLLAAESGNIGNSNCRVASNTITVQVNPIPNAPTVTPVEYCQNAAAAALTASASGTLNWYGTNATGGVAAGSQTPTTATVGTQSYYVSTTVSGCESSRTALPVTVNPLPSISASVGTLPCNGGTGTILSTSSGGTPAYMYSRDGTNFQASNIFNAIPAGTYTITIKDAKNCISSTSVTVPPGVVISLTADAENTCDPANNGKITLGSSGALGAVTYSLDGGAFQSSNIFTGVSSGTHTVTLRDAGSGCELTNNVTVANIINPTVTAVPSLCITGNTGTITASSINGTPAYTYSKDGVAFQNGNVFENLAAGSYTITTKDNRGCTGTTSAIITGTPASPSVSSPLTFCFGAASTPLTASGSNLLWYTAATGGSGNSTSPSVNTISAGVQNFYVSQSVSSCESPRSLISATVSSVVSLSLSKINACNGLSNGKIIASGAGGTSPLTYSLNGGAAQIGNTFENLAPGAYSIVVTDANGCTQTEAESIANGSNLSLTATVGGNCTDPGNGSISPTAVGGTAPLTYKVNSGDYTATIPFTGLNSGSFDVFVKDAQGCEATTTVNIQEKPVALPGSNAPTCQVSSANTIALEALSVPSATYAWTGPNGYTSTDQNPSFPYTVTNQQGTYSLTVTVAGCSATSDVSVICSSNALPVKLISFSGNQFKNTILLNWKASEIADFDRFEIEKSKNARNFEKIGLSPPLMGQETQNFGFEDTAPLEGINYYRLKMIDLDGSIEYSKIIAVEFVKNGLYASALNPSSSSGIKLFTNTKNPEIEIYNIYGQPFIFSKIVTGDGIDLKLDQQALQVVFVSIQEGSFKKTIRVILEF